MSIRRLIMQYCWINSVEKTGNFRCDLEAVQYLNPNNKERFNGNNMEYFNGEGL